MLFNVADEFKPGILCLTVSCATSNAKTFGINGYLVFSRILVPFAHSCRQTFGFADF